MKYILVFVIGVLIERGGKEKYMMWCWWWCWKVVGKVRGERKCGGLVEKLLLEIGGRWNFKLELVMVVVIDWVILLRFKIED